MMLKPEALVEVGWENRSHLSYTHCINIRSFKCFSCFTINVKDWQFKCSNESLYILQLLVVESNDHRKRDCLSMIQAQQSTDA